MAHFRSAYKKLHADREMVCWQQTALCSRQGGIALVCCGVSKRGRASLGTRFCEATCSVLYALFGAGKRETKGWFQQQIGHIWKFPPPRCTGGQGSQSLKVLSRTYSFLGPFLSQNWNGRQSYFMLITNNFSVYYKIIFSKQVICSIILLLFDRIKSTSNLFDFFRHKLTCFCS